MCLRANVVGYQQRSNLQSHNVNINKALLSLKAQILGPRHFRWLLSSLLSLKTQLKGERVYFDSSLEGIQPIVWRKAWLWGCETAGHIVAVVKRQSRLEVGPGY